MSLPNRAALVAVALLAATCAAAPLEFDFKDPKGVNAMTFSLVSMIEPIMGTATGISGRLTFDPADVTSLRGTLFVDAASLRTTHATMTEHLHGAEWLDVAQFPAVTFAISAVQSPKEATLTGGKRWEVMLAGDFTCHGVTKAMTLPTTVTFLPGRAGERMRGAEGDLLVLVTTFSILRTDFGIRPGYAPDKVAEEIQIRAGVTGATPQPQPAPEPAPAPAPAGEAPPAAAGEGGDELNPFAQRLLDTLDTNKDGVLDRSELKNMRGGGGRGGRGGRGRGDGGEGGGRGGQRGEGGEGGPGGDPAGPGGEGGGEGGDKEGEGDKQEGDGGGQ